MSEHDKECKDEREEDMKKAEEEFLLTLLDLIMLNKKTEDLEREILRGIIRDEQLPSEFLVLPDEFINYDLYSNGTFCVNAKRLKSDLAEKLIKKGIIKKVTFNNTKYYCINS